MNLQFTITSSTIDCEQRLRDIVQIRDRRRDAISIIDSNSNRLEILVNTAEESSATTLDADELLLFLRNLSDLVSGTDVRWRIGHQLEPTLGSFGAAGLNSELVIELSTNFSVARSLGAMIDEEYEPKFSALEVATEEDAEGWNPFSDIEETFQRFPELE